MRTFRHDVRLLACLECGGPAEVAVAGGVLRCAYCGAEVVHSPREELDLRAAGATEADEEARLEILWLQQKAGPSESVGPARLDLDTWKSAVRALRDAYSAEAEVRSFVLAQGIANDLLVRGEVTQARAVLEGTLDLVRSRRYVQALRCWMSRMATREGDVESAREWLDLCDPRSEDLEMDGAYRFTSATLDGALGRFDAVLGQLGEALGSVPLPGAIEYAAGLHRANALEHLRGAAAGRAELERLAAAHPRGWERLAELRAANPTLCVESFRTLS